MKNVIKYCLRESMKKERLKIATISATLGAILGVSAGILMTDKEKRQKIKDESAKLVNKACEIAEEAKKIIIKTHNGCCGKKKIVEIYPED